jgi:hypothetical protein
MSLTASLLPPRKQKKRNKFPLLRTYKYNKAGRAPLPAFFHQNQPAGDLMFTNNEAYLEKFWGNILSRDPQKILESFKPLNKHDRQVVLDHLNRMLSEVGWHSEQRDSAQAALNALEEIFVEEERQKDKE